MGRKIKRVDLAFDWPIGKIWSGYLFQTCIDSCEDCHKAGDLMGYKRIQGSNCPDYPKFDPPSGTGYQLWETISEGSPISPVFETPEELAQWLYINNVSSFGDQTCTYEQWLSFIKGIGWAPSMIIDSSGLHSGVSYAAELERKLNNE